MQNMQRHLHIQMWRLTHFCRGHLQRLWMIPWVQINWLHWHWRPEVTVWRWWNFWTKPIQRLMEIRRSQKLTLGLEKIQESLFPGMIFVIWRCFWNRHRGQVWMFTHILRCFRHITIRLSRNIRTLSETMEMHGGNRKKNLSVSTVRFWWRQTVSCRQRTATRTVCTRQEQLPIRDAPIFQVLSEKKKIFLRLSNRQRNVRRRKKSSMVRLWEDLHMHRYLPLQIRLWKQSNPEQFVSLLLWQDVMDVQSPETITRILPKDCQKIPWSWLPAVQNINIISWIWGISVEFRESLMLDSATIPILWQWSHWN